jgi:hypothetical protein
VPCRSTYACEWCSETNQVGMPRPASFVNIGRRRVHMAQPPAPFAETDHLITSIRCMFPLPSMRSQRIVHATPDDTAVISSANATGSLLLSIPRRRLPPFTCIVLPKLQARRRHVYTAPLPVVPCRITYACQWCSETNQVGMPRPASVVNIGRSRVHLA